MKVEMTIPTEQYGNVRPTVEFPDDYTVEKVAEYTAINYRIFANAFAEKPQNTLSDKEMVDYIYNALHGLPNSPDVWETMHPLQKQVLKCYRNAKERKAPLKEKVTK